MVNWCCGFGMFWMNVVLLQLLDFCVLFGFGDYFSVGIIMVLSLDYMDCVWLDVCCNGWLCELIVEMFIFSMLDDLLVLLGKYVVSLFCQYVVLVLFGGCYWDDYCEMVVDLMIVIVE